MLSPSLFIQGSLWMLRLLFLIVRNVISALHCSVSKALYLLYCPFEDVLLIWLNWIRRQFDFGDGEACLRFWVSVWSWWSMFLNLGVFHRWTIWIWFRWRREACLRFWSILSLSGVTLTEFRDIWIWEFDFGDVDAKLVSDSESRSVSLVSLLPPPSIVNICIHLTTNLSTKRQRQRLLHPSNYNICIIDA